ncbi:hypothetical protein [Tautonia rosea]|uniref:hypothetical protein n=1 Tax=Tautonia rosea TaxID=2728037 RepID=UPI0019D15136|nr:hypothetical protein [Tautonia rosea]
MQLSFLILALVSTAVLANSDAAATEQLLAGVAKIEITSPDAEKVNDPCFAKALVLRQGKRVAVLVTVDAVAIGGIGSIPDTFMESVRLELERNPGIPPSHVIVNASHCHGVVRSDSDQLVVRAVREAYRKLVPVKVGAGVGSETRISENRRVTLHDGRQVDMRRAYAFAWDKDIASIGPIDPQIGLMRIDREDGRPLAVLYQFACHPIMNPPDKGSSADFPGVASALIESALGDGVIAFFVQGCGGDINPVQYKDVLHPPDAEPLGNLLGARVIERWRSITPVADGQLAVQQRVITLPRAADFEKRINALEEERSRLVHALKGTNIQFETFLPLLIQQRLDPNSPSGSTHSYLHESSQGRDDFARLDAENRAQVDSYLANIKIMEELTRINTNITLLRRHELETKRAGDAPLEAEMCALRIGDFKLVTFPGELTVEIGLNVKNDTGDPHAFVAGYTNGYLFYTPTVDQRVNPGFAQEDCDCLVAPEWQALFEAAALEMLRNL